MRLNMVARNIIKLKNKIFVEMVDREVDNHFFIDSALLFHHSQSIFLGNCDKNCSLKLFGKLPEWFYLLLILKKETSY